jgi:hypothetical protein
MGGFCSTSVEELPSYSNVLQGTDIPEWVSAGGRELYDQARELAASEFPSFDAPRVATYDGSKLTPEEQEAFRILEGVGAKVDPLLTRAQTATEALGQGYDAATREQLLGDQFSMTSAQPFLDIYQQAADPAVRAAQEQIELEKRAQAAQAARAGAFGGSRSAIQDVLTATEGAKAIGDIRAEAAARGLEFAGQRFDREREARFGAEDSLRSAYETEEASRLRQAERLTELAPLVQGIEEQTAAGLLTAGEARRRLDQMALDLAYADYVEQREFPFQMLNFALGALKGVPYETTQYSLTQGNQYLQSPSVYGQTMGGLGALASAYKLAST